MTLTNDILDYKVVCIYIGKALVGALTKDEQLALCNHITALEAILDDLDADDVFGTEGWRNYFGVAE